MNPQKTNNTPWRQKLIVIGGTLLILCCTGLAILSPRFAFDPPEDPISIISAVFLMMTAGAVYVGLIQGSSHSDFSMKMRYWVMAVGLVMRLVMLPSIPILEDDHYRYLWDGAVTAGGYNPYQFAPIEIGSQPGDDIPGGLKAIAGGSGGIVDRINYPWLRTIYPPLAQAAFGAAHLMAPWSLTAWKVVLAVFDLGTLWLIYRMGLPFTAVLIYWWNPLLVKEFYNSAHLDMLLLPFLVMAAAAINKGRLLGATAALGTAAAIKLWPALLLTIVWRRMIGHWRALLMSLAMAAVAGGLVLLPYLTSGPSHSSGLVAYGRYWEMNDGLYMVIRWTAAWLSDLLWVPPGIKIWMPRALTALMVIGMGLWASKDRRADAAGQFLWVICALFLLSPTQFPWYYLWMLPFLAWRPNTALLLYTALLPLYYLRSFYELRGTAGFFDKWLVWIEHGPVLILLVRQWIGRPGGNTASAVTRTGQQ